MANSTVLFLRRDEAEMKMVFEVNVEYPSGCTASYLQPGFRDTSLFVAFKNCVPLWIRLYNTPFTSEQSYLDLLQGKKVIVLAGHDAYEEEDIFYAYTNNDNDLEFLSINYGDTWALPATDIGSCHAVTDLHSLSTSANTSTLDVIVDCLDSAGSKLRYLVYGIHNEGIDRVLAVNEVEGEPHASEDGAFVAITLQDGDVYSLIVYEVANILGTPASINFMEPFTMKFLQSGGLTILMVLREGENVEKMDVSSFISSNGLEGRVSIPGAAVTSCVQCTSVEIITGNILMTSVWNQDTLFYDLLYMGLESDSLVPSRIAQVSTEPLVFSFVQFPIELTPITESTETESSSLEIETSTAESAKPTSTSGPTTSWKESPSSQPQPLTHPGVIVGWVALCVTSTLCLIVAGVVVLLCVCHKSRCTPKYPKQEVDGDMTPEAATNFARGQIVTTSIQIVPSTMPMQETEDVGYMTSSDSQPSTRTSTPQGTPLVDRKE